MSFIRDCYNVLLFQLNHKVKIGKGCFISRDTVFEGMNKIGNRCVIKGKIGIGTYIGNGCVLDAQIGRFCSISNNVIVLSTNHPPNFVSTSPIFYSTKKQNGYCFVEKDLYNEKASIDDQYSVIIGNDVLISYGVFIMGGITIGDGVIIGANSVVTKDVPPYSIVAGSPAKIIRKRFSDSMIQDLENISWWNWSIKTIKERSADFLNVEKFVKEYKNDSDNSNCL